MRRSADSMPYRAPWPRAIAFVSFAAALLLAAACASTLTSPTTDPDATRLVTAMLGDTPLEEDLEELTDVIGGRPTGSPANEAAVAWAVERFEAAGVEARRQAFEMPVLWLERSARATVTATDGGPDVTFSPRVAAMPFSTPARGLTAPLADGGPGAEGDFATLGDDARGAWVVVEQLVLEDVAGLFAEYGRAPDVEARARAAGAVGVAYMGSRDRDVLYRQNASLGPGNRMPVVALERTGAQRVLRLLRAGRELSMTADLDLETGGPFTSHNVIGEIRGSEHPEEVVVLGAHLDSWGLGTGALDNGCNAALLIDVARQIRRLGLAPKRTLRFALWNGEEQGFHGSWGYVREHLDTLDDHVMALSVDIGSGRISGFFLNGRPEMLPTLEASLVPVAELGPFTHPDAPIVGTDNYDFMVQGVANLVGNHESANYGPNYHAETDTFDKVDLAQLRKNAAVVAAVGWGFANREVPWGRQSRDEVQAIIDSTDLWDQMRLMPGLREGWRDESRGRAAD
jgi:carboxypeptidase Q